jgi:hypothetical protein
LKFFAHISTAHIFGHVLLESPQFVEKNIIKGRPIFHLIKLRKLLSCLSKLSAPNESAGNKIGDGLVAAVSDSVTESGHENIRKYIKLIIEEPI